MSTNFTVKLEQHMSWADQPIFMESIEFDSLSIVENLGTSNQGDVMVMDDIKRFFQNLPDP
jgi:hypothetical protein